MSDSPSTPSRAERSPSRLVIVDGAVLEHVDGLMAADPSREIGGVLIGTADPALDLVVVTGSIELPAGDESSHAVVFTREIWGRLTQFVLRQHPGHRIVGWYHSHPGSGIFVSSHDLLVHTTYFGQPWQVAYVLDPVQDERSFFGWRGNDLERISRWQTTAVSRGLETEVPAREPAHGPRSVRRHLASSVNEAPRAPMAPPAATAVPERDDATPPEGQPIPTASVPPAVAAPAPLLGPPPMAPIRAPEAPDDEPWDDEDDEDDGEGEGGYDADADLDAWMATLDPSGAPTRPSATAGTSVAAPFEAAPGAPFSSPPFVPPAAGSPLPPPSGSAPVRPVQPDAPAPAPPASRGGTTTDAQRRRLMLIVIGAVAVLALIVALIVGLGGDDEGDDASTTSVPATVTIAPVVTGSAAPTTGPTPTDTREPSTTEAAATVPATTEPPTSAPTTTEPSTSEPVTTTTAPTTTVAVETTPTLPPTPSAAVLPTARGAAGATLCPLGQDGFYSPATGCVVPLQNGNVVAEVNGQLVCADPGAPIGPAAPFIIGYGGDPLSIISNGQGLPTCTDLAYARSVMAAGQPVMPGLCGNDDAPIDDTTRRCFAQNLASGSMLAVVRAGGSGRGLVAQCFTASAPPSFLPIAWSLPEVAANWRVTSTGYSTGLGQFVLTAELGEASASAIVTCP